jgi:hypothetical protein
MEFEPYSTSIISRIDRTLFLDFGRVENPVLGYRYFNEDNNLLGSLLRKIMLYHIELVYLYLFCQTIVVASDSYVASSSLIGSIAICLWILTLFLHFAFVQLSAYVSLMHFDSPESELAIWTPCGAIKLSGFNIKISLALHFIAATLCYSFTILDLVLVAIWVYFFNQQRRSYSNLCNLASQPGRDLFFNAFLGLPWMCLIRFHILSSSLLAALVVCVCIVFIVVRYYMKDDLGLNYQLRYVDRRIHCLVIFIASSLILILFSDTGIATAIFISVVQALCSPIMLHASDNFDVFRDFYNHCAIRFQIEGILKNPQSFITQLTIQYFKWFFVIYFTRLLMFFYGRWLCSNRT